jgi:LAGLIDADG DNA endonuclease family
MNFKTINLNRNYRSSNKAYLQLPDYLEEIIIGTMLGDLNAEKPKKNCKTRLQFKQSAKNIEYINHMYYLFQEFCDSPIYSAVKFKTLSLPCFNKYRDIFYKSENIKIIPDNLEEILTAKGLAYWLMVDSYKSNKGNYICTDSYSLNEPQKLIIIFKNKFDLERSYHKITNGYRLYIFISSRERLI